MRSRCFQDGSSTVRQELVLIRYQEDHHLDIRDSKLVSLPPLPEGLGFSRLAIPLWASQRQLRPEIRWLTEHIYKDIGQTIFEDYAHQFEWMMLFYIANEPEIILRLDGKTSSELGSGPQQLLDVARAAKKAIDKPEITRLTATIPRTGVAKHYISLFTCKDPATGEILTPRIGEAMKMLNALPKDNSYYETFYNDMDNLVRKVGANSSAIPVWAKSSRTQSAHRRRKRIATAAAKGKAKICDVETDDEQIEMEAIDEEMAVDFGFTELIELMNQLTAANIKAVGNEELTGVVIGLSSALKNLIAYTIKQGENFRELQINICLLITNIDSIQSRAISSINKPQKTSNRGAPDGLVSLKSDVNSKLDKTKLKRVAKVDLERKEKQKRPRTDTPTRKRDAKGRWLRAEASERIESDTDSETEYEIEKIVAKRPTKSGRALYRVRRKGWDPEWDEWKTTKELEHAKDLVVEYERRCDEWNEKMHRKESRAQDDKKPHSIKLEHTGTEDMKRDDMRPKDLNVDTIEVIDKKLGDVEPVDIKQEVTDFDGSTFKHLELYPGSLIVTQA